MLLLLKLLAFVKKSLMIESRFMVVINSAEEDSAGADDDIIITVWLSQRMGGVYDKGKKNFMRQWRRLSLLLLISVLF